MHLLRTFYRFFCRLHWNHMISKTVFNPNKYSFIFAFCLSPYFITTSSHHSQIALEDQMYLWFEVLTFLPHMCCNVFFLNTSLCVVSGVCIFLCIHIVWPLMLMWMFSGKVLSLLDLTDWWTGCVPDAVWVEISTRHCKKCTFLGNYYSFAYSKNRSCIVVLNNDFSHLPH